MCGRFITVNSQKCPYCMCNNGFLSMHQITGTEAAYTEGFYYIVKIIPEPHTLIKVSTLLKSDTNQAKLCLWQNIRTRCGMSKKKLMMCTIIGQRVTSGIQILNDLWKCIKILYYIDCNSYTLKISKISKWVVPDL